MNPIPRIDFDSHSSGQPANYSGCKMKKGEPVGPNCRQVLTAKKSIFYRIFKCLTNVFSIHVDVFFSLKVCRTLGSLTRMGLPAWGCRQIIQQQHCVANGKKHAAHILATVVSTLQRRQRYYAYQRCNGVNLAFVS